MDRVGDIMERLGFNSEAEDSVKAAFIQNLMQQAYGVKIEIPEKYKAPTETPIQLGFNLDDAG